MVTTANHIGAVILLVFGILLLVYPQAAAPLISLGGGTPETGARRARAELRVNFGAFWVGLGAAALYFNQEVGYQILGAGWALLPIVRVIAYFVDRPQPMRLYWLIALGEVITAVLLFA